VADPVRAADLPVGSILCIDGRILKKQHGWIDGTHWIAAMLWSGDAVYDRYIDQRIAAAETVQVLRIGPDQPAPPPNAARRLAEANEALCAAVENGPWVLIPDPDLRRLVGEYVADACHHIAAAAGLDEAMERARDVMPARLAASLPPRKD
jgi:hypothetical protein